MSRTPQENAKDSTPDWRPSDGLEAYDMLSTALVIADADFVIQYVNDAAARMFKNVEDDLRKDLPHFRTEEVLHKNIDYFHTDPAHQRALLENLRGPHDAKLHAGGKTIAFRTTPRIGAGGKATGYVVELKNVTTSTENKRQIEILMNEATEMAQDHENGTISSRIPTDELTGEYALVAERVNTMVDSHIEVKRKVVDCMQAFAEGDFDFHIEAFTGDRQFITDAVESARSAFQDTVAEITTIARDIAAGKLDREADTSVFKGAYRIVVTSLIAATGDLNRTLAEIREQVTQISSGITQINSSARSLSHASQTQSGAVDEISAAIEETEQTVRANNQQTAAMRTMVSSATEFANEGIGTVDDMVRAMDSIRSSSEAIAKIIKSIDEIAFQTNLLALNAAVEAARAGEHGRGFAVVAQEVRNLAGRSAKAAKETSDLIAEATRNVARGVDASSASEVAFKKIHTEIGTVKERVDMISDASEEQSKGVEQISCAASDLSKSGLEVSAQAEELAAASSQMESSTTMVREMIDRFHLAPLDKAAAVPFDLQGITPEMREQLMALLAGQPGTAANASKPPSARGSVDNDPRGYSSF